jgi:aerobic-type carbon monoxide dehydrogenase small subunit (CoxS/CutS family)
MPSVVELQVNGKKQHLETEKARTLLSVLRDDLDLTGSKYGCGEGRCGACTVLVDGRAVKSCSTTLGACAGTHVTTIEGLEKDGKLHPLQQAFLDVGAMQCGYCTTGMIMAGVALLSRKPDPGRQDIVDGMNGNICRCGTYNRIIEAIHRAAVAMKGGGR